MERGKKRKECLEMGEKRMGFEKSDWIVLEDEKEGIVEGEKEGERVVVVKEKNKN